MIARHRRLIILLVAVIPVIALIVGAVFYIFLQVQSVMGQLDVLLVDELKRQTGRAVEVKRVETSLLQGSATIYRLRIANGETFESGTLLTAEKLVVDFQFIDLVLGRKPAIQTIRNVKLVSPNIFIERFRTGQLNIQDLITPKPGPPRPPFTGSVEIVNGNVTFRDWLAQVPGQKPVVTKVAAVDGFFDAAEAPFYVYNLTARGPKGQRFERLSLSGSINDRTGTLSIDLRADDIAAGYWSSYFLSPGAVNLTQGNADLRVSATRQVSNGKREWSYAGSANINNGQATIANLTEPATNLRGRIELVNQTFNLDLSANLAGSPIELNGKVVGFSNPRLDLRIISNRADYSRLASAARDIESLRQVALSGQGPLSVNIIGPTDDPVVSLRAVVPAVGMDGYRASDVRIQATYANETVDVDRASARIFGGQVSLSGVIALNNTAQLSLSGIASDVNLAQIPQLRQARLQGTASGRFSVSGTADDPVFATTVQVSRGTLDSLVFNNASADITIAGDRIRIERLTASIARGVVRVSGDITANQLDLQLAATGVDLNQFEHVLQVSNLSGTANFNGQVVGPTQDPIVTGSVEVFDGGFDRYQFDYARGNLSATRTSIAIEDTLIRVLPAEVIVRGRIAGIGTKAPVIEIDADIAEAAADRILTMLQVQADVIGNVTGTVSVRGTTDDIQAEGNLVFTDGAVAGYPVAEARTAFSYSDGQLRLTDLLARSDSAILTAEGTVDRQGNLNLDFVANDVSLVRLNDLARPYAVLSGTVDISGNIAGTTESPVVAATVVSESPTINTVQFNRVAADLAWSEDTLTVTQLVLLSDRGALTVDRVSLDTQNNRLQVQGGELKEFSYPALYVLIAESPYIDEPDAESVRSLLARLSRPDEGMISASFMAEGPIDQIEARVSLDAQEIDIGEIENVQLSVEAVSRRGEVLLESFEAAADALNVTAQGTLIANGQIDLEVDAYNVDLAALTPATCPTHISGIATARADIEGPIDAPTVTASIEMVEPTIYGIEFDRLRASQITIAEENIDISRVLLTRDDHSAVFYGVLPWNWETFSVPVDRPIDLHATLEEQTLEILTILTDAVTTPTDDPGLISAAVDVTGTVANPNLSGQMMISNGNIGIKNFQTSFNNVQAHIIFEQDLLRVETFTGASSAGGTFQIVPGGTISLGNLVQSVQGQPQGEINLALVLNELKVVEQDLLGYQERITGSFTTTDSLTLTGSLNEPFVAGTIVISDASVLLARVPETSLPSPHEFSFNPRFDLSFRLRDDVWFRNPSLVALLEGQGTLTGSLQDPHLSSNLRVASGQIRLPTARMRITRGIITVGWTRGADNTSINVDLRAQTSVTATSPTGTPRRYTIVLEVDGPLDSLQPEDIDLRSDPAGLTRTQILAALGHFEDLFGSGEFALREQIRDLFAVAVSPMLFDPLESSFIEALGLEEFDIEYGFEQPLAVFLTRHLLDDFYLSYWRIVTGTPSITGATYSLTLSYRLRDWFEVGYVTDSRRVSILQFSYNRRF